MFVKTQHHGSAGNRTMSYVSKIMRRRVILFSTVAAVALASGGAALRHFSNASAQPKMAVENPAVPVGVLTVAAGNVRVWSEFSGRLNAVDYAEIRPEVSGRIAQVRFRDGQTVKAGDILFVIDPRPYEAALAKAQANLASARTNAEFAQTELDRAANLVKEQAIAQRLYDERANTKRVADAAVQAAEAELKQAELDIDHAYVKAPITGRLSRAEVTLGNLVQAGSNAPVLTSIVSNDGICAEFDNKDASLVPGMFVSVRLGSSPKNEVLLVPERAVGNDQNKKFIYVVGRDDKVAYREVSLGQQVGGGRIVLSGLQPGERVVVDGLQHIAPDVKVQAKEQTAAAVPETPSAH